PEHIYRVQFYERPIWDIDKKDFYFTSLAAIFDVFTPEQVGCRVENLWNNHVTENNPYRGRKCTITKERLTTKARKAHKRRTTASKNGNE
ncbi:MAG: hypothetical protein LUE27_10025, partial [Clostridia bacterium]|nr:hypothetical protein [Clostridia bacterium]